MGLPGAWVITSDERTETIAYCLKSIRESLRASRPESARGEWTPNAFIVDCALSELAAVRQVFGESVAIFWCHWHVMQAMKKRAMNVTKKYREKIMRDVFSLVRDFVPHNVKEGLDNFYRKMNTFMEFCKTCTMPQSGSMENISSVSGYTLTDYGLKSSVHAANMALIPPPPQNLTTISSRVSHVRRTTVDG